MPAEISVTQATNGYIVHTIVCQKVYSGLDEVLERILCYFEGQAPQFKGDAYGRVVVVRGADNNKGA